MTQLPTRHGQPVSPADPPLAAGQERPAENHSGRHSAHHGQQLPPQPETPAQRVPHPEERSAPGTIIGSRYTLRTAIGHGGMGTVWRAADTLLRRDVAVKEVLLPPGIAAKDREQMYQRTLREARAAAALSHPSVVQVYDVVTEGGRPWIVMELLQSRSLAEMIIEDGPLAARAVAKIGVALLGALEVAHANGVLHRDVKPANVLICSDGRCVLTDFGVARMPADAQLTTPGMVLGSPHFISPERAIGAKFGPPSDLFSLGVTLYTAVEGHPPFDKREPFETMRAIVEEPPASPTKAGSLTGVLYGLLEKDPAKRWEVQQTRKVLRELLAGPLASNAPAHFTDPYAVVRPAPISPSSAPPIVPSHIGGRAMLAPGESITGAMRRRHSEDPENPHIEVEHSKNISISTGEFPGPNNPVTATATNALALPAPRAAAPIQRTAPARSAITQSSEQGHQSPTREPSPYPIKPGIYGRSSPSSPQHGQEHTRFTLARLGPLRHELTTWVHQLPRWGQISGVALAAIALIGAFVIIFDSDESRKKIDVVAQSSASPNQPLLPTQEYQDDRGFAVNVPAGWTKKSGKSYVDFVDPADEGRRLRMNVENASGTAERYLEIAENGLKKTSSGCPTPYTRVELRGTQLDHRPAAELEYTCGAGVQTRHGIWGAVIHNGKAYQFFVSVQDSRFIESKIIYDEMARSYRLIPQASGNQTT